MENKKQKADKKILISVTIDEYRYAVALSLRVPECKRPYCGSASHGFRWALREQAKKENLGIF